MARKSIKSIRLNTSLRCNRIYPTERTSRSITQLKTVGLNLSPVQATTLATALLAAAETWPVIDVTAYRFQKSKGDGTFLITVTSP